MNTRIEVDKAGEGAAGAAAVRDRQRTTAAADQHDRDGEQTPGREPADRVSVDPLRGTDRYRLVLPLPLPLPLRI